VRRMKIFPTICYSVTAIVVAWILGTAGRFQLVDSSSVPFVINRSTGEVWKFYMGNMENGKPPGNGVSAHETTLVKSISGIQPFLSIVVRCFVRPEELSLEIE
jgi:hypothetical protein